jgi:4a-hydroxytetrahydrobiopterin dehydratase
MSQLGSERCVACRSDSPKVTQEEINKLLPEIPDWQIIREKDIPQLTRLFSFKGFSVPVDFTMAIALLAKEQGHHPRIILEWGKVSISWWTHKIRNLHRNDFIMAKKTDDIFSNFLDKSPN